ncbi:MAG: DUF1553 domain-containing protein [Planctomycetes bacterium]|nr:DUF1553 domain-containing protein [Planctomycetota bacterium]
MLRGLLRRSFPALLTAAVGAQQTSGPEGEWWAYRPLSRPAPPAVEDERWVRSPIDAFVLAGLERRGLEPAPSADRHTLLRRVTYDLTGLPPTQAEIDAFVADTAPDAYDRVVDRLLASPQYGVKWAQHWLDVVRYAETDGYERDSEKPFVWRYRDWVIDAINADMPYGEFLTRQLAGDELPDAKVADHVATGYYRLGIWDDEPTDREQHRYDDLDGIADTTARSMLAISMGCARCHDHKKDPLPQRDYHSFLGYFENIAPYDKQAQTIPTDGAKARYEAAMAAYERDAQQCREALQALARERLGDGDGIDAERLARAAADVVARYDGDVASATELLDAVGGHHGAVDGQVVQVDGRRGKALRFDGDDHARIPRVVEDSFTVSFFVRSDQRGRGRKADPRWFTGTGLVDGEVPGIVDDWGIAWIADGMIAAGTGRPETFVHSASGYDDGAWHHVAFTRDRESGRIALYVDGQLAGSEVGSKRPLTTPDDLVVGRMRPGGPGFHGDLDELTFFGRALSDAEVAALALELPGGIAAAEAIAGSDALARLTELRTPDLETVKVLAVRERGVDGPIAYVRLRGNVHAKGPQVELGVPGMLGEATRFVPSQTSHSSGRRLALAKWITAPDNRLTWRVIANRLWQHHFGRGIVRSSNDFGRLGDRPTHPQLLDWLACEVLARGQSLKAMHRLIVCSSTYRMSSQANPAALAEDPLNDAFWRFDRRRLTAEEVRDSILAVNGTLNPELGGPSVYPPLPKAVLLTASRPDAAWGKSSPRQAARRSIFVHVKRSLPEPLLASFDRADTDNSCPVRFATVQPTQALSMINGDFANLQAERFAKRLAGEVQGLEAQLRRGLELTTQRPARDADLQRLLRLAKDLRVDFGRDPHEVLQRCCLVMLNSNEFLFLD